MLTRERDTPSLMPNTPDPATPEVAKPIRLCVVDDHALFREGLIRLLASDSRFEVVFHTGSTTEALALLTRHPVDILILDYDLGPVNAVAFVRDLKDTFKGRILIVTAGLPDSDALELIRLGIGGIFHKQDSPEDLQTSIHQVAAGRVLIDQKYLQSLVAAAQPVEETMQFTEREQAILRFLLQGLANKEIAVKLRVSESAVKSSLQLLFNKLGVRTRSQLVLLAIEKYRSLL
jgi:two-component system nitrate/nitrite response regulator NarL